MNKALANNTTFAVSYLLLMLPAYYLPLANTASTTLMPDVLHLQWMVILCAMLALCWLCVVRGALIGKRWLVALPAVAIAFELIPRLSAIPYVSSSYHLLAIIIGLAFPVITSAQSELTKV